ncbi:HdeA/HdeB family chaperone [Mesorhizobium sp. BAC0120]|uniref:HdeA/HdeB family chaperone n=1 Tax=Mesorhizobium sp. BAC0120 TaxID=3090670 RepID=UPI00298C1E82|nr:HdeA/HdeB family chaperone [Mesorhizobium sp. BAC0120]MDW6021819.1 HdeA/HdeB family chaperone [Mesorhizobium sp. BAC0120]
MKRHLPIIFAAAIVGLAGQATAAEVDMSKLTCKQLADMSPAKVIGVAMWMSGYAHGKAGNPKIDGEKAQANAEKVADYCKSNPTSTLASALQQLAKS